MLENFAAQVACVLSQPGYMGNVSPVAGAEGKGLTSWIVLGLPVVYCRTLRLNPASAPLVKVITPKL